MYWSCEKTCPCLRAVVCGPYFFKKLRENVSIVLKDGAVFIWLFGKSGSIISCVLCHCIQVRRLLYGWKGVSRSWNLVLYVFELLEKNMSIRDPRHLGPDFGVLENACPSSWKSVPCLLKFWETTGPPFHRSHCVIANVFHRSMAFIVPSLHCVCDTVSLLATLCYWYISHCLHGVLVHVSIVHGRVAVSYMLLNIEVHLPKGSIPIAAISCWAGTFSRQIRPVKKRVTALLN